MKHLISVLVVVCAIHTAHAQLPSPDAKSLAMGGVVMTTLSGSHAIYGNAAMATLSTSPAQISASYVGQGVNDYYAISGACRFDNKNMAHAGWRQFLRPQGGNDLAADMAYSRRIGDRWAVGVTARYMRFNLLGMAMDALAADLSAAYALPLENLGRYSTLRAGARLGNLGSYLSGGGGESLPMDLTAGVALDSYLTDAHQVVVATDLGYYLNPSAVRGFQWSVGAEYNLMQLVQVRGGYHYGEDQLLYPSYWSVGAGVRFLHLRLDFAYLFAKQDTPLHKTYSVSFGFDF